MVLVDVNVLVYAYREDAPEHGRYSRWLRACIESEQPYGIASLVLSGFLRVVTHPGIFDPPSPLQSALEFAEKVWNQPNCVAVAPGEHHWSIFTRLCRSSDARGNLVPDAYLAAIAMESGCELVTTDTDFARFPGLRRRHPLRT